MTKQHRGDASTAVLERMAIFTYPRLVLEAQKELHIMEGVFTTVIYHPMTANGNPFYCQHGHGGDHQADTQEIAGNESCDGFRRSIAAPSPSIMQN